MRAVVLNSNQVVKNYLLYLSVLIALAFNAVFRLMLLSRFSTNRTMSSQFNLPSDCKTCSRKLAGQATCQTLLWYKPLVFGNAFSTRGKCGAGFRSHKREEMFRFILVLCTRK